METVESNVELDELRSLGRVSSMETQQIRSELSRLFGATEELTQIMTPTPPPTAPLSPPPITLAPLPPPLALPKPPGRHRKRVPRVVKDEEGDDASDLPSWLSQAELSVRDVTEDAPLPVSAPEDTHLPSSASDLSRSPTELQTSADDLSQLTRVVNSLSEKLDALERMLRSAPRHKGRIPRTKNKFRSDLLTPMELERQRGLRQR